MTNFLSGIKMRNNQTEMMHVVKRAAASYTNVRGPCSVLCILNKLH